MTPNVSVCAEHAFACPASGTTAGNAAIRTTPAASIARWRSALNMNRKGMIVVPALKTCDRYVDDKSCLQCPYPAQYMPCLSPETITVTLSVNRRDAVRIDEWANLAGISRAEVIRRMIRFCRRHVNPRLKEKTPAGAQPSESE